MDSSQIQNTLKALCKVMWDNNVTNPITYVTQISYLPHEGASTSEFLCHHFLSEKGIEDIRAASPGSAGRNRTLGLKKLEQINVPVPDYHEQVRFAGMAERRRAIQRERTTVETELKTFQSALLAKAFRGEL